MKYYIIIRGPLGVGKSTIAKKLASALHAEYISLDSILEKMKLDKVYGKSIPLENFLKVNRAIIPDAKKSLEGGETVIFDGNFYHREQLQNLIRNLKTPHYIFTLKASLETCVKRDKLRKRSYGRRATESVYKLVTKFNYGIPVDAELHIKAVLNDILSRIPKTS